MPETSRYKTLLVPIVAGHCLTACMSDGSDSVRPEPVSAPEYELAAAPYTSLQQVWAPREPTPEVRSMIDDGTLSVYDHSRYEGHGLGVSLEPGLPWIEHLELAPGFPGEGGRRRSLAYILVIADPQLIDEESPIRMDGYDKVYRPHGQLTPQLFEAHVRTARRISDLSARRFDFTLLPGDLTDTTQQNELAWMIDILNGGVVDPDSGVDDDPVPGPGNDFNDPFLSAGTNWPWYPALGNHDVLHVGGFGLIDAALREAAQGDRLFTASTLSGIWGGYVAADQPDSRVVLDDSVVTPADPRRLPLYKKEFLQALHDAEGLPAGHGFSQEDVDAERGYYSAHPLEGRPLRLIVLDSTDASEHSLGIAQKGSMDAVQLSWLHEELIAAESNRELVIVMSHHRLEDFHEQSEAPAELVKSLLVESENVVLHIAGHGHTDRKRIQTDEGRRGYWELMSASTIDFPLQSRIIELVDEGNGYLSIYVTNFDHNSREGSLAHKARMLAGAKLAFGYTGFDGNTSDFWARDVEAQNLLIRLKLPDDISSNISGFDDWATVIESLETLSAF
jgi:3',5'-cyclic AMP phosphodiesterase CpdA